MSVVRGPVLASIVMGTALAAPALHRAGQAEPPRRIEVLAPAIPSAIDPYADPTVSARSVFHGVFEPLVRLDADGHLLPALAQAWMSSDADASTFHLRPGVRFHDGTPLSAARVVEALGEARGSPLYAAALAPIVGVRAEDEHRVVVRTRGDAATLVYALSGVPIARRSADGRLVGTGPYEVRARGRESVELDRFAGYYGRRPFVETAVFRAAGSGDDTVRRLRLRPATVVVSPSRRVVHAARQDDRYDVQTFDSTSLYYLGYDLRRAPLSDLRVRRAVRAALDVQRLVNDATAAGGAPASQLLPPGVFGHDPDRPVAVRDVTRARRLLAEAGRPRGFSATLDASPVYADLARALVPQLSEAGIEIRVRIQPVDDLRVAVDGGQSALFIDNWVFGKGSGITLASFLHTRQAAEGLGLRNRSGYSNVEVDVLLEAALQSPDPRRRARLLRQAMVRLLDDLPVIPLFSARGVRVAPRGLSFPIRPDGLLSVSDGAPVTPRGAARHD